MTESAEMEKSRTDLKAKLSEQVKKMNALKETEKANKEEAAYVSCVHKTLAAVSNARVKFIFYVKIILFIRNII